MDRMNELASNPSRAAWGSRAVLAVLMLGSLPLYAVFVGRTLTALDAPGAALAVVGAILGLLAVDAVSGFVHWACDTWGDERTPVFGPTLIHSFREHHRFPQKMLCHDFVEVNRETLPAASVALGLLLLPAPARALEGMPLLAGFLITFILSGSLANQLHQWAHQPRPPRLVRGLQRGRLVLAPRRHARHHRPPHMDGYCIATGWLNPLLDGSGFWRRLERLVTRCTGIPPREPRPGGKASIRYTWEDRAA